MFTTPHSRPYNLQKPWICGVSDDGYLRYAVDWTGTLPDWNQSEEPITEYVVDYRLPEPPTVGAHVDPQKLDWIKIQRHLPMPSLVHA